MKTLKLTYALSIFFILSSFLFAQNSFSKNNYPIDFTLTDTNGNTVNLFTELQNGKTVLLFFFSTNCIHCEEAAPIIDSIYQQFGSGSENLLVWGIAYPLANNDDIIDFINRTGINFPCFYTGPTNDVHSLYDISYTPQFMIVCQNEVSPSLPNDEIVQNLQYCFNATNFENLKFNQKVQIENNKIKIENSSDDFSFLKISDINGKIIQEYKLIPDYIEISLPKSKSIYLINLISKNGQIITYKFINTQN